MIGYVRAAVSILPEEEQNRYKAVYCGLCHSLGRRYGLFARLILSYDFVFLAMLLMPNGPTCEKECHHCPVRPWTKKQCFCGSVLDEAADRSLILFWWQLKDSILDGTFSERFAARCVCLILHRAYRKAAARLPEFDSCVRNRLEELHILEQERTASLDRPADTFAKILQSAADGIEPAGRASGIGQILYHVGRWVYILDAWDDREEDRIHDNYNPILARFEGCEETAEDAVRQTLNVSLGIAGTALDLLDFDEWEELLTHIVRVGLPAAEEAVFSGIWKKKTRHII